MTDSELDSIIEKADRAREGSVPPNSADAEPTGPRAAYPYSFRTFWAMKGEWEPSMRSLFLWNILYALCFLATFYLAVIRGNRPAMVIPFYASLALSLLCVAKILRYHLAAVITYPLYPGWTRGLSFQVEGWEKLASFGGFVDGRNFVGDCTVTVQSREADHHSGRVIDAALYLFSLKANLTFLNYYEGPGLKRLSHKGHTLAGSVNCAIAGKLYRFIKGDLQRINRKIKVIERVVIQVGDTTVPASELPKHDSVG